MRYPGSYYMVFEHASNRHKSLGDIKRLAQACTHPHDNHGEAFYDALIEEGYNELAKLTQRDSIAVSLVANAILHGETYGQQWMPVEASTRALIELRRLHRSLGLKSVDKERKTSWRETEYSKERRRLLDALKPFKPQATVTPARDALVIEWFGEDATWAKDRQYAIRDIALELGWVFHSESEHRSYFSLHFTHPAHKAKSSQYYPNKDPNDPHAFRNKLQVRVYTNPQGLMAQRESPVKVTIDNKDHVGSRAEIDNLLAELGYKETGHILKSVIAVDLHGTIGRKIEGNGEWRDYDPADYTPMKGAKEALQALKNEGHEIVVWTCWDTDEAKQWLKMHAIPHDAVNEEGPNHGSPKVDADAYVDDKAVPHDGDWTATLQAVRTHLADRDAASSAAHAKNAGALQQEQKTVLIYKSVGDVKRIAQQIRAQHEPEALSDVLADALEDAGYSNLARFARTHHATWLLVGEILNPHRDHPNNFTEPHHGELDDLRRRLYGKSVDKGKGEPCKQGERASTTGCIPATKPSGGGKDGSGESGYGGKRGRDGGRTGRRDGQDREDVEGETGGSSDETTGGKRSDASESTGETASSHARKRDVLKKLDGYESALRKKGLHAQADWIIELRAEVNRLGVEAALEALGEERTGDESRVQYVGAYDYYAEGIGKEPRFLKKYLDHSGITLAGKTIDPNAYVISSWSKRNLEAEGVALPEAPGNVVPTDQTFKNKLEEAQALPGLESSEDIHKVVGKEVTTFTPDVIAKLDEKYGKGKWIVKSYGDEAYAGFGIFFPQRVAQIQRDAKASMREATSGLKGLGYTIKRDKGRVVGIASGNETYAVGTEGFGRLDEEVQRLGRQAVQASHAENGAALPASPEDSIKNDYGISFVRDKRGVPVGIVDGDGKQYKLPQTASSDEPDTEPDTDVDTDDTESGYGGKDELIPAGKQRLRAGIRQIQDLEGGAVGHAIDRALEADEWRRKGFDTKPKFMVQPAFKAVGVTAAERAAGVTWETAKEGRVHCITRDGKASAVPYATLVGRGDDLPATFASEDTKAMERAVQEAIDKLPESERTGQLYAPDVMKTKDGWKVIELNPSAEGGGSDWLGSNPFVIDALVSHMTGREPQHVKFMRSLLKGKDAEWEGMKKLKSVSDIKGLAEAFYYGRTDHRDGRLLLADALDEDGYELLASLCRKDYSAANTISVCIMNNRVSAHVLPHVPGAEAELKRLLGHKSYSGPRLKAATVGFYTKVAKRRWQLVHKSAFVKFVLTAFGPTLRTIAAKYAAEAKIPDLYPLLESALMDVVADKEGPRRSARAVAAHARIPNRHVSDAMERAVGDLFVTAVRQYGKATEPDSKTIWGLLRAHLWPALAAFLVHSKVDERIVNYLLRVARANPEATSRLAALAADSAMTAARWASLALKETKSLAKCDHGPNRGKPGPCPKPASGEESVAQEDAVDDSALDEVASNDTVLDEESPDETILEDEEIPEVVAAETPVAPTPVPTDSAPVGDDHQLTPDETSDERDAEPGSRGVTDWSGEQVNTPSDAALQGALFAKDFVTGGGSDSDAYEFAKTLASGETPTMAETRNAVLWSAKNGPKYYAAASTGATVGATIGAVGGPPGMVVGGAVGAAVAVAGTFAASCFASMALDAGKWLVGQAWDAVMNTIDEAWAGSKSIFLSALFDPDGENYAMLDEWIPDTVTSAVGSAYNTSRKYARIVGLMITLSYGKEAAAKLAIEMAKSKAQEIQDQIEEHGLTEKLKLQQERIKEVLRIERQREQEAAA